MFYIDEAFEKEPLPRPRLDVNQAHGKDAVIRAVVDRVLVAGVGPPGSGKTSVSVAANVDIVEKEKIEGGEEAVVFLGPTNKLVHEAFTRFVGILRHLGYDEKQIMEMVRVYGSRIHAKSPKYQQLRRPPDENVVFVFSTEYQPGMVAILGSKKKSLHIQVDEATSTEFHEPFISLADAMQRRMQEKGLIGSLSVIGDPEQALVDYSITSRPGRHYEVLIAGKVLLSKLPKDIRQQVANYELTLSEALKYVAPDESVFLLETTHRLPSPTERPISSAFYGGVLKARVGASERLKGAWLGKPRSDFLERTRYLKEYGLDTLLEEALTTLKSMVIIDLKAHKGGKYSWQDPDLERYEPLRAEIAVEVASYLAKATNFKEIAIVAPYDELVSQIFLAFKRRFRDIFDTGKIKIHTVHTMLGSEADAVIAVLGKEYSTAERKTIYFQMPELLNVQFSRHRALLIGMGNFSRLASHALREADRRHRRITVLCEQIYDLCGYELTQRGMSLAPKRVSDSDICAYMKIKRGEIS